ncbi:uncharacterized protein ALTATR162_LOCUS11870 [Alternaria atra]|uniref:Uncharacterized protein n=1 Tax=Alternaria atra TaxID=119953 RepID=A0A8J2N5J7_9PLEO|nr:uncharacterized protein ALTATR162_LOCUS11870 [Alternaria atra]CAG5188102.1 unnamed protein product [Alternaria atra]
MTPFVPRRRDVHRTRALLHHRLGLPNELVLDILDKAHYWVEHVHENDQTTVLLDEDFSDDFSAAHPLLRIPIDKRKIARRETSKLREMEFLVVSHDQGWTTENTIGTYNTSSWFEVSIVRPGLQINEEGNEIVADNFEEHMYPRRDIHSVIEDICGDLGFSNAPRPSSTTEPQRLHCDEMQAMTFLHEDSSCPMGIEGQHAWYLQGNEVARAVSKFEGDYIRRYRVVWGCRNNPTWEGNEGAGRGENFIDSLQDGDWICVWARAKRRGWETHVHGIRVTMRYTV